MRRLSLEELKRWQLDILDVVAAFCDEHGIVYWIDWGTLLGAIRHKGYIPWDDDIDIGMLRPDYDRFMKLFNERNERYKFMCAEIFPQEYNEFGRVCDTRTLAFMGLQRFPTTVHIDVFAYDNAPDDDALVTKMFDRRDFYKRWHRRLFKAYMNFPAKGNVLRRFCVHVFRTFLRLLPRDFFVRKFIRNAKSYNSVPTKRWGGFMLPCYQVVWDKELLSAGFMEAEFEGRKYKIPREYDQWLKAEYGDYMTPPPVEERVSRHNFEAYVKEPGE